MRFAWCIVAALFLLAGCSSMRQTAQVECDKEQSLARGVSDGKSGHRANLAFLKACTPATKSASLAAYRQGFEASRPKHKPEPVEEEDEVEVEAASIQAEPVSVNTAVNAVREPSTAPTWVCEVEANSKIFTGVGATRDDALGSARATCGSHLQASYCVKADCKQSL